MSHHSNTASAVVQELSSDPVRGLNSELVQQRQQEYGENKLQEKKKKTNFERFLNQFKDVMIIILLIAAVISFVVACVEGEPKEFFEPVLILLIVIITFNLYLNTFNFSFHCNLFK